MKSIVLLDHWVENKSLLYSNCKVNNHRYPNWDKTTQKEGCNVLMWLINFCYAIKVFNVKISKLHKVE